MRIKVLAIMAYGLISLSIHAQDFTSKSYWPIQKIVVDGKTNEWEKPLNFYNAEAGMTYSLMNDSSYLYLCFICNNGMKARKLMRAGWEIELSSKEKNRKFKALITFPGKKQDNIEKPKEDYKSGKGESMGDRINTYLLQLNGITSFGFKTLNGEVKINGDQGILLSIAEEGPQTLVYEIAIPMNEIIDSHLIQFNELMKMNVHINSMDNPSGGGGYSNGGGGGNMGGMGGAGGMGGMGGAGGMGGMGGMGGGGGMRGGGGGMRGGGGGNYSADRSMLFEKVNFKLIFKLSPNKKPE